MQILFKLSNSGGKPPTVANSNLREHYAGINTNIAWSTIEPSIRQATERNLIPYISRELYNSLATTYHGAGPIPAEQQDIITRCQDVVAYFAILSASSELNVGISDMGVVEKGSSQAPVMPVAQWRFKDFKYQLTKKADEALDGLLRRLEEYVHEGIEYFDLWKESKAYEETRTAFFSSAAQFDRFICINSSRRMFSQLQIDIVHAEEDVDHIICQSQFNALVDIIKEGEDDATQLQKDLIKRIRRYVSAKAIVHCVPRLFLRLDGRGLVLSSYTDGMDSHNHLSSSFRGAEAVGAFVQQIQQSMDIYFKDLMSFVNDNIDDLPLIKESDCWADVTSTTRYPVCPGAGGVFL